MPIQRDILTVLTMLALLTAAPLMRAADQPDPPAPTGDQIEHAIRRGVDFLIADQNRDGTWGTAQQTKGLNILSPVPGGHRSFRLATTALCISALIESADPRPGVVAAVERAEAALLEQLPRLRRQTPMVMYNCWSHSFGLQALADMRSRLPDDAERIQQIDAAIADQIGKLERYEYLDGGWGYLDFKVGAQKSTGDAVCFVAATGVIALHEVKQLGAEPPQGLVDRAVASIKRQQNPDFTYLYSENHRYAPRAPINRPMGSLGRSQVCNLALRLWGDKQITDDVLIQWLDRLFARNGWLSIGRKRPVPHESWAQVAGYFYYYGHYYAAMCIHQLPADKQAPYQQQMAQTILPLQEKDGSWWDYPLYNYHQQYGTAMAISTLTRCR